LCLRHEETARYCREEGLKPVADSTNASPAFLRNRVRLELLPLLRRYNPRVDSALLRLAEAARADLSVLEEMAAEALSEDEGGRFVELSRKRLTGLPEGLQRHALRLALRRVLGDLRDVHQDHIEALLAGLARGAGHHLDLPRGLRFDVAGKSDPSAGTAGPWPPLPRAPHCARRRLVGLWREAELTAPRPRTAAADPGRPGWTPTSRVRSCGCDRGVPATASSPGHGRREEVSDFFVDACAPPSATPCPGLRQARHRRVAGHRIDERARVTGATRRVLRLLPAYVQTLTSRRSWRRIA
jgi:hypothetical protein